MGVENGPPSWNRRNDLLDTFTNKEGAPARRDKRGAYRGTTTRFLRIENRKIIIRK